jgi:hypothetical protein
MTHLKVTAVALAVERTTSTIRQSLWGGKLFVAVLRQGRRIATQTDADRASAVCASEPRLRTFFIMTYHTA